MLCTFVWILTRIEDSLSQDGTKLGHDIIVLVIDHLCIKLPELVHLRQKKEGDGLMYAELQNCIFLLRFLLFWLSNRFLTFKG